MILKNSIMEFDGNSVVREQGKQPFTRVLHLCGWHQLFIILEIFWDYSEFTDRGIWPAVAFWFAYNLLQTGFALPKTCMGMPNTPWQASPSTQALIQLVPRAHDCKSFLNNLIQMKLWKLMFQSSYKVALEQFFKFQPEHCMIIQWESSEYV